MASSLIDDAPEGVNTPEYSVSEISRGVKRTLETAYGHVRVRGELGRVTFHRNGHCYLDLKDEGAVLAAVIWKASIRALEIRPQEGDEVIATGRITTFPGQSKYQLVIEQLSYAGEGALLAKLERLRKQLAAEGLFDEAAKKPLPYLPRVIGVVTSPTGAVIRDILHRLAERFPVHVLVWPVAVQGPGCAPEVAAAIRGFDALPPSGPVPRPDVLIVARGGGSIEDLWGFNEEAVVRAAHACTIPLISAVGHETDTTLIDFAADRRAPTPTAAAEMAVSVRAELSATVADLGSRAARATLRGLELRRQRHRDLARALPRPEEIVETRRQRLGLAAARLPDPRRLIAEARRDVAACSDRLLGALRAAVRAKEGQMWKVTGRLSPRLLRQPASHARATLDRLSPRLDPAARRSLGALGDRLSGLSRILASLSEARTLARGFAIVRDAEGRVLTRAASIAPGTALELGFADGRVRALSEGGAPRREPRPAPARKPRQGSLFDDT